MELTVGYIDLTGIPRNHPDFHKAIYEVPDSHYYMVSNRYLNKEELTHIFINGAEYVKDYAMKRMTFSDDLMKKLAKESLEDLKKNELVFFFRSKGFISDDEMKEFYKNLEINRTNFFYQFEELVKFNNYELFKKFWEAKKHRSDLLSEFVNKFRLHNIKPGDQELSEDIQKLVKQTYYDGEMNKLQISNYAQMQTGLDYEIYRMLSEEDNREVINNLASNPSLPLEIQWEFADKYKTPYIRENIARLTKDIFLLDRIYKNTKSKSIREAVEKNPVFMG